MQSRPSFRPPTVSSTTSHRVVDQDELERLRIKMQSGIFCTKYPFGKRMFRAKPKKTRVEVDVGKMGPRLTWGSSPRKEAPLSEFQNVTMGIKSDVFRRFESKMMKTTNAQPNQCVSLHGKARTVDLLMNTPEDAQDLKRYVENVIRNPGILSGARMSPQQSSLVSYNSGTDRDFTVGRRR